MRAQYMTINSSNNLPISRWLFLVSLTASNGRPLNLTILSNVGVASDDHGYSLFFLIRVQRRLKRRRWANLTITPDPYYLQVSSNPHPPVQYGTSLDFYPSRSVNDGLAGDVIVRRRLNVIVFGVIDGVVRYCFRTHFEAYFLS